MPEPRTAGDRRRSAIARSKARRTNNLSDTQFINWWARKHLQAKGTEAPDDPPRRAL